MARGSMGWKGLQLHLLQFRGLATGPTSTKLRTSINEMEVGMKALVKAVKRAVRNVVARYEVCAYEQGEAYQWGSHKVVTRGEALEWMRQYPARASVYVFDNWSGWRIVAERKAA